LKCGVRVVTLGLSFRPEVFELAEQPGGHFECAAGTSQFGEAEADAQHIRIGLPALLAKDGECLGELTLRLRVSAGLIKGPGVLHERARIPQTVRAFLGFHDGNEHLP
jgi:hypothetical protein